MVSRQLNQFLRKFSDVRNIVLYLFVLIVLAISWSGVKTIQTNYVLQKQISALQQQNVVIKLQNENTALQNRYYVSDQYLDLAARQDLGLAGPGETVLLVPKNVALKYVDQSLAKQAKQNSISQDQPRYIKNLDAWKNFLLGRTIVTN